MHVVHTITMPNAKHMFIYSIIPRLLDLVVPSTTPITINIMALNMLTMIMHVYIYDK